MLNFFVRRPVATAMIYAAVFLLGFLSLQRLKVSLFPDIVFPKLIVLTPYAHVAPEEMENLVTIPIEDAVGSVSGVKKIVSRSEEGLSIVEVTLDWGSSLDLAVINIRQKVDLAKSILPQDTGKSIIVKFDPSSDAIVTLVAKPAGIPFERTRDYIDKNVRPLLERVDGVASLSILGGWKREIHIDVDARKLFAHGLTLDRVSQSLSSSNFNFPAGNVRRGDREFTVRVMGEFPAVSEISNVVVSVGQNGAPVFLRDVADIKDDFKDRKGSAFYNGEQAIVVGIKKEPGKNTIETVENIHQAIEMINRRFERTVQFEIIQDRSTYITDAIHSVAHAAVVGGLIAFLVVYFYLKDLRAALIINISAPMAVISTFAFMYLKGISINIMSLGGLALGVGHVVDSSVVVLEAISQVRHEEKDLSIFDSAIKGTRLVAGSVIASTFTSIIVFVPIIFVSGIAGEVFRDLAYTVSFSLLSSLFCAFTLLPMLACVRWGESGLFARTEKILAGLSHPAFVFADRTLVFLQNWILRTLEKSLNRPRQVLLISLGVSAVGLLLFLPLKKSLFPEVDQGIVVSEMELPGGVILKQAEEMQSQIHSFLKKNELAVHTITILGHDEDDLASAMRGVKKPGYSENQYYIDRRHLDSRGFIDTLSEALSKRNLQKNFRIKGDVLQELLGESGAVFLVEIECRDRERARQAAKFIFDRLQNRPELISVRSSAVAGSPEIKVRLDRDKLASFGLAPGNVGELIRNAIDGSLPTMYREGDVEIPIRVRLREEDRQDVEQLHNLYIQTGEDSHTQLGNLIHISDGFGHSSILRENQRRLERLRVEYRNESEKETRRLLESLIADASREFLTISQEERPLIRVARENEETMESLFSLFLAFALSIVLIYLLLAGQFESLLHPLTLALSIPLMLFGVSASLLLTGHGLNITSAIGMIMLVGLVANASVIMYGYIQHYRTNDPRRDLAELPEIIQKSVRDRIRPILLTTLTTILGLVPLAIPTGSGGDLQAPMAVAVMGGLSVSTLLTMVAFPTVFYIMEKFRLERKIKSGWKPDEIPVTESEESHALAGKL